MASAYPIDLVQAERWLESHKNLKGDQLKAAVGKQPWDDSIKSLVATPDALRTVRHVATVRRPKLTSPLQKRESETKISASSGSTHASSP